MEIINKNENIEVCIEDIEVGECFIVNGKLYLRVDEGFYRDKLKTEEHFCMFVIDLTNNRLNSFRIGTKVNRVKAKLIVE